MASTWGTSWGTSWATSWDRVFVPPTPPPVRVTGDAGGAGQVYGRAFPSKRRPVRELYAQLPKPKPSEPAVEIKAQPIVLLPSPLPGVIGLGYAPKQEYADDEDAIIAILAAAL